MTIAELIAAVERVATIGPHASMCEDEEARGYKPVIPGTVPWLSTDDWPDDVVIAQQGCNVRIVAIYTKHPGQGAFSRLITAIAKAGLRPTVVCPTRHMAAICKAWGWRERIVGSSFQDREDHWFPPRKWLDARRAA